MAYNFERREKAHTIAYAERRTVPECQQQRRIHFRKEPKGKSNTSRGLNLGILVSLVANLEMLNESSK
jgi:hypothetical protein